uniref:Single domain-containing protein n=1 Tax=Amblyomma triste TaxID=251400 RepID=A0A023G0U3_AMBTT
MRSFMVCLAILLLFTGVDSDESDNQNGKNSVKKGGCEYNNKHIANNGTRNYKDPCVQAKCTKGKLTFINCTSEAYENGNRREEEYLQEYPHCCKNSGGDSTSSQELTTRNALGTSNREDDPLNNHPRV